MAHLAFTALPDAMQNKKSGALRSLTRAVRLREGKRLRCKVCTDDDYLDDLGLSDVFVSLLLQEPP